MRCYDANQENVPFIFGIFVSQRVVFDIFVFEKIVFQCLWLWQGIFGFGDRSLTSFIPPRGLSHWPCLSRLCHGYMHENTCLGIY